MRWGGSSLELNLSVDISCRIRVDQFVVDAQNWDGGMHVQDRALREVY